MDAVRKQISHMKYASGWSLREIYSLPIPQFHAYWNDLVDIKEREAQAIEKAKRQKK